MFLLTFLVLSQVSKIITYIIIVILAWPALVGLKELGWGGGGAHAPLCLTLSMSLAIGLGYIHLIWLRESSKVPTKD